MKIYFKLFISALLFFACNENNETSAAENIPLYPDPVIVGLDTTKGYTINPITGNSIKPLINSYGDTVKTGVLFPFHTVLTNAKKITPHKIIKSVNQVEIIIRSNVDPLPQQLTIIPVDTTQLKRVKSGEGTTLNVVSEKMPFHEPHPVKALPLRYKDFATANVQYLDVDQVTMINKAILETSFWVSRCFQE